MALTQLINDSSASAIFSRPFHRVSVRAKWTDDWQKIAYLECLQCSDAAAPTLPKATFRWRYGNIKRVDMSGYANFAPTDLKDWFVKVEILPVDGAPYTLWIGVFADEDLTDRGTGSESSPAVPSGDQLMNAYGLAYLLDRTYLYGSAITNDGTNLVKINAPLAFNQDYVQGFVNLGNRSASPLAITTNAGQPAQSYVFANTADDGSAPAVWTAQDIVYYLLYLFGPTQVPFVPGGQIDALVPLVFPRIEVRGQTLFQILNQVIDRRYGVGWEIFETDATAILNVFTVLDEPIKLDSAQIPANQNTATLDLASMGHLPQDVRIEADTLQTYSKILITGEPILSMFTVGYQDGTLVPAWGDDEESAYKNPGSGLPSSSQTAPELDRLRSADKFAHVYSAFKIPSNWGWFAGTGEYESGTAPKNANPLPDPFGKVDGSDPESGVPAAPIRNWGHRLLRSLPILKDMILLGAEPEYCEPLVFIQDPTTKNYRPIDRSAGLDDVVAHVRILDQDFGVEVRAHPQHLLALNSWDSNTLVSEQQPSYDYKTLVASVAARTDTRLSIEVDLPQNAGQKAAGTGGTSTAQSSGPGVDRTLLISVLDAELWYVTPGTVLDLDTDNGKLIHASPDTVNERSTINQGLVVRDDSPRLRQIAAFAQAWFGTKRSSLTLDVNDIWPQYPVGTYLQSINDRARYEAINSVVTQVIWDLQTMRTSLRTQFVELDFSGGHRARRHTIT